MNYRRPLELALRHAIRDLIGLSVASVAASLAVLPLAVTAAVGTPLALLGGLWTTCLLLGLVVIVLFRHTTTIAERGIAMAIRPCFLAVARQPAAGLQLGVATFVLIGSSGVLVAAAPAGGYRSAAAGAGVSILVAWSLLVAFGGPELGAGAMPLSAFRAARNRLAQSPMSAAWFLLCSLLLTLVAGVTLFTTFFFLPGLIALLATHIARDVDEAADASSEGSDTGP